MDRRIIGFVIACMLGLTPAYAANVCDPDTPSSCARVNSSATGGGGHVADYSLDGWMDGQKATYVISTTGILAEGSIGTPPTTVMFSICGAAQKVVQFIRFNINASVATTAIRGTFIIKRMYSPITSSTNTLVLSTKHDDSMPLPQAIVTYYDNWGIGANLVGVIGTRVITLPVTGTAAATDFIPEVMWDFDGREMQEIILYGTQQCIEIAYAASTATIPSHGLSATWTEEPLK